MKYTAAACNTKLCTNCHKEIPALRKKCPFCGFIQSQYYFYLKNTNSKRNKEVVDMLNTGEYSLEEVGKKFGVTRERVRQIYKRDTGKSSREKHQEFMAHQTHLRELEILREKKKHIRFLCTICGKPVTEADDRRLLATCSPCSREYRKTNRHPSRILTCLWCKKKFHPYRNYNTQIFCSNACYFAHIRKFGRPRRGKHTSNPTPPEHIFSILRINGKIVTKHA